MRVDRNSPASPVAIVAGVDVNGLGVVRSLGRAGVPILALDTNLTKATLATRFGTKVQVPTLSGERFVESLLQIASQLPEKPVLFLTEEDSVATVCDAQERLANAFHFSMPGADIMHMLMDKHSFQGMAEKLNCPIPHSIRLVADMDMKIIDGLRFPCVVKPLTKVAAFSSKFAKAYKVSNAREVAELWTEMRKVVREVIVQEWIEGGDSDVFFCLQYRRLPKLQHVSFVGRKICQWPPLVGGTASCVPAPYAWDELVALTDRFFDDVGFVGLGSMEFKRDVRDSKFYMVEPTVGRTDYQEEIATLNGVNIPFAAYCGALGRQFPPTTRVAPPRAWRDSNAYQKARAAGAPDPIMQIAPQSRVVDAYLRLDDPLPFVRMKFEPVERRLRRLTANR